MGNLTEQEMELIKKTMFGDFGIYRLKDGIPKTLYISDNLHLACGMTKEEFLSYTQEDATGVVLPSDRQIVLQAMQEANLPGHDMDIRYRVLVKGTGFLWVRARGHVCGTRDGDSILIVSYAAELNNANNLKAILDNLDCAVYIRDKYSFEILYVNKEAMKFARLGADITRHTTCHQFFFDAGDPCQDCILPKQDKDGRVSKETYLEKKQCWVNVSLAPLTIGGHDAFIVYIRDITKQKKLQEQYKKSMQDLLDTIPESLGTFILNGTKNTCSEGFGRSPKFIKALTSPTLDGLRANLMKLIPDEAQRKLVGEIFNRENALAAFAQGKTDLSCDFKILLGPNVSAWVKTNIHMFSNPETGDVEGVAYSHDITDAKKREKIYDILTSREFDLITFIYLNSGLYEPIFVGDTLPTVIKEHLPKIGGRTNFDAYCTFAFNHWVDKAEDNVYGKAGNIDYVRKQIAQSEYYEFIYATNLLNADGKVIYRKKQHYKLDENTVLVFESDVTKLVLHHQEQVEHEKQLRQAAEAASKAKSDFLSRISHDMRTPLNGIIGMTYLTEQMELPTEAARNLKKIDTSSKFLLGMINEILDLNKIENNKMVQHLEPGDAQDYWAYLDAVIRPICAEKSQKLIVKVDLPEDYAAMQDKLVVSRLAFNLLSNACKYTPEGGTISCTVTGKVLPGGKQMEKIVTVSDNGIGMSEHFQKIMFDAFTQENGVDTSEKRGSGLGLAIVKRLVELIGGTIEVKSALGKGTSITITALEDCLPKSVVEAQMSKAADNMNVDDILAGKKVLYCEDHPLNQQIIVALLKKKGVFVDTAVDGQIGVQKFKQSTIRNYSAILMDIRMPVMDGYEATKAIRQLKRPDAKTVPIIALSANAFAEDVQKSAGMGMNGHLAKPINPKMLYATLAKVMNK